jgi:hypothetical protein
MEASYEGGQRPEGAIAPWMEWNRWTDGWIIFVIISILI